MKNIQKFRLIVQLAALVLFALGFFTSFQLTLIVVTLAAIISGVYYCGWLCPFGTLQELSSKLARILKIKKRKMPKAIQKYLIYSRYIIYAIFTLFTIDILFSLLAFDPRTNLLQLITGNTISVAAILVMLSFLIISLFFERPFCNYLCIEGAKYGIMSLLRPVTIKRNESSCVACNKCNEVCPMNIEVSTTENLHSPNCINCFECVSACPVKETLTYGPVSLTSKVKKYYIRIVSLGLIVTIGFLLYSVVSSNADESDTPTEISSSQDFQAKDDTGMSIFDKIKKGKGHHDEPFDGGLEEDSNLAPAEIENTIEESSSDETPSNETAINETSSDQLGDAAGIADGTYSGEGRGYRGYMTVEVTVENELITKVEVSEHVDDLKWYNYAYGILSELIVDEQSVDVNTVSGATYSARGIIEGANAALESARN